MNHLQDVWDSWQRLESLTGYRIVVSIALPLSALASLVFSVYQLLNGHMFIFAIFGCWTVLLILWIVASYVIDRKLEKAREQWTELRRREHLGEEYKNLVGVT